MKNRYNQIEKSNKRFFKKIADKYDKGIVGKILNKRVSKTLVLANVKSKSKVLDIGCGTGTLLYFLSRDRTLKLYGIDISDEMFEIAQRKLNKKAILKLGPVRTVLEYYKKNYFDYIFIDDAFHHLSNQEEVLEDLKSLLKENGKLIISDLSFGSLGNFIFHKIEPGNSGMHTSKEYTILFEENGFKEIKKERPGLFSIYIEGTKMKGGILK